MLNLFCEFVIWKNNVMFFSIKRIYFVARDIIHFELIR